MRQKLDSTSVLVKDLSDQPDDSKYVLFLAGFLGDKVGLAVDAVREKNCILEGWYGNNLVAQWNPTMPWALVERSRLEWFSVREWLKRLMRDSEESRALVKEMFPNGDEAQGQVGVGDMSELVTMLREQGGSGQGYL